MLLSTRDVRGQVDSQAPSVSDCWSNLKQKVRGATDIVDRAAISFGELSEMQHRIEEQQKKIDNSEMPGIAGARLEEQLRQLKFDSQRLGDQLLETKRQLEYAGNQRESCRRQVETLKKEL